MTNQGRESSTTAKSVLSNIVGIVAGLVGALFALVTLGTPTLKILGLVTCVAVAALMLQAAHDREQGKLSNGMLWWLSATGVVVLALVVFLATNAEGAATSRGLGIAPSQQPSSNQLPEQRPSEQVTGTGVPAPTGTADTSRTSSATPGPAAKPTYLADLQAVATDGDWPMKSVQVKGVAYDKALSSSTGWCGARSRIDYVLGVRFSRFQAMVGLADDSPGTGPLNFTVFADNKQVKTIESVGVGTTQPVDISVVGVTRLSIRIEGCSGTVGVWIDPRVT